MSKRNIGEVSSEIDALVRQLGLTKIADAGEPVGESAGVISDPGTTHPAKQEANKSNIQPAKEGARSVENVADTKREVKGQPVADANPSDADNKGSASSTENITTATFVGEDPKVEDDYKDKGDDPGTTHPADVNKNPEKYSSAIDLILKEAAELQKSVKPVVKSTGKPAEKTAEKTAESKKDKTIGDRLVELVLEKDSATEAEKTGAIDATVRQYLEEYTKTSSLIGTLTADVLDKMAEEGDETNPAEEATEPKQEAQTEVPADLAAAAAPAAAAEAPGSGVGGDELDAQSTALAEAAVELAQQLGCTPEEVLQAAMQEAQQLESGNGAAAPSDQALADNAAGSADVGQTPIPADQLEAMASKAAKYDEIVVAQEKEALDKHIEQVVTGAMDKWFTQHQATK